MGGGVHIVWGIFRVFHLYNCNEEKSFYLRLVIWSWYIGAIIGSCCAGYAVGKFRKGHLYVCIPKILELHGNAEYIDRYLVISNINISLSFSLFFSSDPKIDVISSQGAHYLLLVAYF